MKKALALLLVLLLLPLAISRAEEEEKSEYFLYYDLTGAALENNMLILEGALYNASAEEDILGIRGGAIIISNGVDTIYLALPMEDMEFAIIPRLSRYDYPIAIPLSQITFNLNQAYVGVQGDYTTLPCTGEDCPYCLLYKLLSAQNQPAPLPTPRPQPKPTTDPMNKVKCDWCDGSGICDDCGGTGDSRFDGILGIGGCRLCNATGDCYKCKGDGLAPY